MGFGVKDAAWFQTRIDLYSTSKDHKKDLFSFLDELKHLSLDEKQKTLPQLDFTPMFSVLVKWNNPVFAEPFLELVNLAFDYLEVQRVISNNEKMLLKFYTHVNNEFRSVLFNLLNKAISKGEVECFKLLPNLMDKLVHSIQNEPDSPALEFLKNLISAPNGPKVVFGTEIGQWLSEICEDSDDKFEIIELAVQAAMSSEENYKLVKSCQIFSELEAGLQGAMAHVDQSGFAATVECYTELGTTAWGYQDLLESGVLAKLEARVVDYGPGTMEDKVMPVVYRFFGKLFEVFPEKAKNDCPRVVPTVVNLIEISIDRAYVTRTEIEMIGMVAAKPEGKLYLASLGNPFTAVLLHLKTFILSNSSGDKICALETLAKLVALEEGTETEELTSLTKSWFATIFETLKQLVEFCQEPFPGVTRTAIPIFVSETVQCRNAGLQLLLQLVHQSWGRQELCQQPRLLEWLVENEKSEDVHFCINGTPNEEVMQLKCHIASVLLRHPNLSAKAKLILQKVEQFQDSGPDAMAKRQKCL